MRELVESFSIVPDRIWREILTLESLESMQGFHVWHGVLGGCVGALAMWLLFPKKPLNDLSKQLREMPPQAIVDSPGLTESAYIPPESTSTRCCSSFLWVGLAALVCGILGIMVVSGVLLLWLLPLALIMLSLCAWDMRYYVVPDWLNLSWLGLGAMKGFAPLAFSHLYASSQNPIPNLELLGGFGVPEALDIDSGVLQNLWEIVDIAVLQDMLLGAGLIALVYMLGLMVVHRQLLGEGDIIFCAGFSALFGFEGLLLSIFWGCVVACVLVLGARIQHTRLCVVPLIPCMTLGLFIGLGLGVLA